MVKVVTPSLAAATDVSASDAIVPFRVAIPQDTIDDLRRRLAQARWPDRETVDDWSQGVPLSRAQDLLERWRDGYDWRAFETRINSFPQFRTRIDGLGIHFLHVRSAHANALPILLTHGWPGSVIELLETVGPLTDPTARMEAFDLAIQKRPNYPLALFSRSNERSVKVNPANGWPVRSSTRNTTGAGKWVPQSSD